MHIKIFLCTESVCLKIWAPYHTILYPFYKIYLVCRTAVISNYQINSYEIHWVILFILWQIYYKKSSLHKNKYKIITFHWFKKPTNKQYTTTIKNHQEKKYAGRFYSLSRHKTIRMLICILAFQQFNKASSFPNSYKGLILTYKYCI